MTLDPYLIAVFTYFLSMVVGMGIMAWKED